MIVRITEYELPEEPMFDPAFLAWLYAQPVSYLTLLYKEWYNRQRITDREIEEFTESIKKWKFYA